MTQRIILIIVWLLLVVMAARLVPNWRHLEQYESIITPSAKAVLNSQEDLMIQVFAHPESRAAVLVNNFLQPLLKYLPDVTVEYLNVADNPQLVNQFGITQQGEMVINSDGDQFHLSTLSYETFFNGLKRMDTDNDEWIVFLSGIQGQSFDDSQLSGMSRWLKSLSDANYSSMVWSLNPAVQLPKQTRLLVLASPTIPFNDQQLAWLEQAIAAGVSVLWLTDPRSVVNQPDLSLLFDVLRTDSYHQGQVIVDAFVEHEVNKNFDRPLDLVEVLPYETATQPLWLNQQGQTIASTQEIDDSRLMVIGDSDFLSNQNLNSGGNLEMSYRMVDWLMHNEDRIDLPTLGIVDSQIHLQRNEILWFAGIMLLLVPLLFLLMAVYHWRQQHK